jgi:hypothetical protein
MFEQLVYVMTVSICYDIFLIIVLIGAIIGSYFAASANTPDADMYIILATFSQFVLQIFGVVGQRRAHIR